MIVVAGLSPAWQQILRFRALQIGEVNRARQAGWCASGKVLNVARALRGLDVPVRAVTLLGGPHGDRIADEWRQAGLPLDIVRTTSETRVCTTLLDEATQTTTELVENVGPVTEAELSRFAEVFRRLVSGTGTQADGEHAVPETEPCDLVVLTGSLPEGAPATYFRDLLRDVRCRSVLDVRGPILEAALEQRPFLVKPNRVELELTVGRSLNSPSDIRGACRELHARGAVWVLVTDGPRPVTLSSLDGVWQASPPQVEVVNPIGAGDCLTAGLVAELWRGRSPVEALPFALAAGACTVRNHLPARITLEAVRELAGEVTVVPR